VLFWEPGGIKNPEPGESGSLPEAAHRLSRVGGRMDGRMARPARGTFSTVRVSRSTVQKRRSAWPTECLRPQTLDKRALLVESDFSARPCAFRIKRECAGEAETEALKEECGLGRAITNLHRQVRHRVPTRFYIFPITIFVDAIFAPSNPRREFGIIPWTPQQSLGQGPCIRRIFLDGQALPQVGGCL